MKKINRIKFILIKNFIVRVIIKKIMPLESILILYIILAEPLQDRRKK